VVWLLVNWLNQQGWKAQGKEERNALSKYLENAVGMAAWDI
jgi:hypothetical protein